MAISVSDLRNALNPKYKSDEQKRLSVPGAIDDYFKKNEAVRKATEALERGEDVPDELKSLVNVDELKKQLADAKEGKSQTQVQGNTKGQDPKSPTASLIETTANSTQSLKAKLDLLSQSIVASAKTTQAQTTPSINPLETTSLSQDSNIVSFTDDASGKTISVTLSDDNVKRLTQAFGTLDKASDLVKGWYQDAAYNVGYLQSDINGDGTISQNEAKNLKALITVDDEGKTNSYSLNQVVDDNTANTLLNEQGWVNNLNDFINNSLTQDANLDGNITLTEMLGGEKALEAFAKASLSESSSEDNTIFRNISTKEDSPVKNLQLVQLRNLIQSIEKDKNIATYQEMDTLTKTLSA